MTTVAATRKDFDDVLGVLDVMMTRIDERFSSGEATLDSIQTQVQNIFNQLDGIEKRLEISDDERLVMAHQLTQLHEWVERAADRSELYTTDEAFFSGSSAQITPILSVDRRLISGFKEP